MFHTVSNLVNLNTCCLNYSQELLFSVDEIEEELGPLSESLNPTQPESYESQLNSVKEAASKISWTRIMGKYCETYSNLLLYRHIYIHVDTNTDRITVIIK